ncbi:hypothetical protein C1H46_021609 [Malus baccata]|uniref:Uncharacterized protein n=1 Tax=Malus baccata TaxID=106549 RepID=A0A540M201_MALBA|nr:hypothetical protein C1H46_021609 [Malus baccata]
MKINVNRRAISREFHQWTPNHSYRTPECLTPAAPFPDRTSPIIIWYIIKHPRLVIMTHICVANDPTCPKDSLMTPEYVVDSPECVNLIRNSTETSANKAMITISTKAGITPSTLRVAGMDMILAPIMLVDTLNTAPETDPRLTGFLSCSSGTWASATGNIPMAAWFSCLRERRQAYSDLSDTFDEGFRSLMRMLIEWC